MPMIPKLGNTVKQISTLIVSLFIVLFIGFSFAVADSYNPEVYQAQKALKELGYNPGKPDGVWGKATQRAIRSFQRHIGLPVTGRLDDETKLGLGMNPLGRGIRVKVHVNGLSIKEIKLYSGYYALIVGCGDYRTGWPRLANPVKDAREVASMLKGLGWTVDVLENPDGNTLRRSLQGGYRTWKE